MGTLALRHLARADEVAAREAHGELAAEGGAFFLEQVSKLPWAAYVDRLRAIEAGHTIGRWETVAEIFRVAVVDGELVGRVAIKPTLTPWLAEVGGHIGYAVRPTYRRRGHATAILRAALEIVHKHGIVEALLTCHDDNEGSIGTIEACGGLLRETRWVEDEQIWLRRYTVPTGPTGPTAPTGPVS